MTAFPELKNLEKMGVSMRVLGMIFSPSPRSHVFFEVFDETVPVCFADIGLHYIDRSHWAVQRESGFH